MTEKIPSIDARILEQLKLIASTNEMIISSKKVKSSLMVRQYEHLKKELTKNLFDMLKESYQITIPVVKEVA